MPPENSFNDLATSCRPSRGHTTFMTQLEEIFGELGLSQYLDAFEEQGFDTWETILDITESDLDALGVKLGHRRKLQRRIANHRGIAPEALLVSPIQGSAEDPKSDRTRTANDRVDGRIGAAPPKRKYRRHPKPDENAPERPPSAYVLFSNKMREDLKGRNLSFTEIAKLVGENWQSLSAAEKKLYETEANQAKEKYHQELAEYKRTPQYREYAEYLEEFRKRQGSSTNDSDTPKRLKADGSHTRANSNGSSAIGLNGGGASGSESARGSEPPPAQRQRMSSVASLSESPFSYSQNVEDLPHGSDHGEAARSQGLISPRSHAAPNCLPARHDSTRSSGDAAGVGAFPWSTGPGDGRGNVGPPGPSVQDAYPFPPSLPSLNSIHGPRSRGHSGSAPSMSRPPSLRTQESSTGSISSGGSFTPRTPSDAPLPIHALLSKPEPLTAVSLPPPHTVSGQQTPHVASFASRPPGANAQAPYSSNFPSLPLPDASILGAGLPAMAKTEPSGGNSVGLDALLRAGEIVNQQQQQP